MSGCVGSRAVRSRVKRRVGCQSWASAGGEGGGGAQHDLRHDGGFGGRKSSVCEAAQFSRRVSATVPRMPSKCFCGSVLGFTANGDVALSSPGAKAADGSALLTGLDLEAWRDWRQMVLRSPSEAQEVIALLEGRVAPHGDPVSRRIPSVLCQTCS